MGTIVKLKQRWGAGIHVGTIKDVYQTLDKDGVPKKNRNGDYGIDVVFVNDKGDELIQTFWYHEPREDKNTQWFLDLLLKATELDNSTEEVSSEELIGKKVWVFVANEYLLSDDLVLEDETGDPIIRDKLIAKFGIYIEGGMKPAMADEPERNDGEVTGIFAIYTQGWKVLGHPEVDRIVARMIGHDGSESQVKETPAF